MKPEEIFEILEENYKNALEMAINETSHQVSNDIKSSVDIFIEKIDTDKSLVAGNYYEFGEKDNLARTRYSSAYGEI